MLPPAAVDPELVTSTERPAAVVEIVGGDRDVGRGRVDVDAASRRIGDRAAEDVDAARPCHLTDVIDQDAVGATAGRNGVEGDAVDTDRDAVEVNRGPGARAYRGSDRAAGDVDGAAAGRRETGAVAGAGVDRQAAVEIDRRARVGAEGDAVAGRLEATAPSKSTVPPVLLRTWIATASAVWVTVPL